LEDRDVEAEALAAGRGGGDDDVAPAERRPDGLRLVRVETLDAPLAEGLRQPRGQGRGGVEDPAGAGQGLVGAEAGTDDRALEPPVEDRGDPAFEAAFGFPGRDRHGPHTKQTYRARQSPPRASGVVR